MAYIARVINPTNGCIIQLNC